MSGALPNLMAVKGPQGIAGFLAHPAARKWLVEAAKALGIEARAAALEHNPEIWADFILTHFQNRSREQELAEIKGMPEWTDYRRALEWYRNKARYTTALAKSRQELKKRQRGDSWPPNLNYNWLADSHTAEGFREGTGRTNNTVAKWVRDLGLEEHRRADNKGGYIYTRAGALKVLGAWLGAMGRTNGAKHAEEIWGWYAFGEKHPHLSALAKVLRCQGGKCGPHPKTADGIELKPPFWARAPVPKSTVRKKTRP